MKQQHRNKIKKVPLQEKDTPIILKEPYHANFLIVLMDPILSYLSYPLIAVVSSLKFFLWILTLCAISLLASHINPMP